MFPSEICYDITTFKSPVGFYPTVLLLVGATSGLFFLLVHDYLQVFFSSTCACSFNVCVLVNASNVPHGVKIFAEEHLQIGSFALFCKSDRLAVILDQREKQNGEPLR